LIQQCDLVLYYVYIINVYMHIALIKHQIYAFNVWNATFGTFIVQKTSPKYLLYYIIMHFYLTALLEYATYGGAWASPASPLEPYPCSYVH